MTKPERNPKSENRNSKQIRRANCLQRLAGTLAPPVLLEHEVVGGPHFAVGTGGTDFHLGAGDLVEEKGCPPIVDEFAALIDAHAIFFFEKNDLIGIAAIESGRDLAVVADRIAAESRAVVADGASHVLHNGGGRQAGERFRSDDIFDPSFMGRASRCAGNDFDWLGFS